MTSSQSARVARLSAQMALEWTKDASRQGPGTSTYLITLSPIILISITLLLLPVELLAGKVTAAPDSVQSIFSDELAASAPDGMLFHRCTDQGFFAIDKRFGPLTFDTAKLVDIAWDMIFGRGGQVLLIYTSYRAYSSALLRIIELNPVSYKLYMDITFRPGEASTILSLIKNICQTRGWRVRIVLAWLLLATMYLAAFPTIASAMTSYVSPSNMFIRTASDAMLDLSHFAQALAFPDGTALGLSNGIRLCEDGHWYNADGSQNDTNVPTSFSSADSNSLSVTPQISIWNLWDVIINDLNSTREPYSPLLCPFPAKTKGGTLGWWESCGDNRTSTNMSIVLFSGNQSFPAAYALNSSNTACMTPNNGSYQWGFSYGLSSLLSGLTGIFVLGMYTVSCYAEKKGVLHRRGRRLGEWRVVLDLAAAMNESLNSGKEGDLGMDSETELRKKIAEEGGGGSLQLEYTVQLGEDGRIEKAKLGTASKYKRVSGADPEMDVEGSG